MLLILHSLGWDLHLIPWIGFNPFPLFFIWNPNWANGVRWDLILKLGFKPFLSVNKTNRADWLRSCSRAFIWSFCISYPKLANGIRWDHALCSDSDNKPSAIVAGQDQASSSSPSFLHLSTRTSGDIWMLRHWKMIILSCGWVNIWRFCLPLYILWHFLIGQNWVPNKAWHIVFTLH